MNVFAGSPANIFNTNRNSGLKSALDLIGNTALLELKESGGAKVYAKAEFQNPSGSIKDRMVAHVIQQAELSGELKPGQTIVEATSGNTGVSLAMVAAIKGYKAVIVAPDSTSSTKRYKYTAINTNFCRRRYILQVRGNKIMCDNKVIHVTIIIGGRVSDQKGDLTSTT